MTIRKQVGIAAGVLVLAGATVAVYFGYRWYRDRSQPKPGAEAYRLPPTIIVSVSYPGANAQVVADTVAAPIEEQVNGALLRNAVWVRPKGRSPGWLV